jgi:hypothetical protein
MPILLMNRNGKSHYTENEAAQELGISLENLRSLVRRHILADSEDEVSKLAMTSFQPSDLLLLRLLISNGSHSAVAG